MLCCSDVWQYHTMEYASAFIREFQSPAHAAATQVVAMEVAEFWLHRTRFFRPRVLSNAREVFTRMYGLGEAQAKEQARTAEFAAAGPDQTLAAASQFEQQLSKQTQTMRAAGSAGSGSGSKGSGSGSGTAAVDELGAISSDLTAAMANGSGSGSGAAVPNESSLHDYLQSRGATHTADAKLLGARELSSVPASVREERPPELVDVEGMTKSRRGGVAKTQTAPLWPLPELSSQFMCFEQFQSDYPRALSALNIQSRVYGYVYLLDATGRIRWRAVGPPAVEHSDMITAGQYSAIRLAGAKPIKAEVEVMLRLARQML